jgi:glutamate-1-semialdehyde aminotransferase
MLPATHRPYYEQLKANLEQLLQDIEATAESTSASIPLAPQVQQVQQYFQQQIMTLPTEEVDAAAVSRVQSVQTELHRYLRLLGTEVNFLAVSRNPSTTEKTLANLRDRVQKLIAGCDTLLGTDTNNQPS